MALKIEKQHAATELLSHFLHAEAAYTQSRSDLMEYLNSLMGSTVTIRGYTSGVIIASSVSEEGQVLRRTSVPAYRTFVFEGEDNPPREPIDIAEARLDNLRNDELSLSLLNIAPPIQRYKALGYVLKLRELIYIEPVPTIAKT